MSLLVQITEDLNSSLKAGQPDRVATLRLLVNGFKNEQIKLGHELSDEEALKVLQKEAKQRKDSVEAYTKAGRDDLAGMEEAELAIISNYLPAQISEADLAAEIDKAIAAVAANSMAQMGAVVGRVLAAVGARSDGATVSRMVREKLS